MSQIGTSSKLAAKASTLSSHILGSNPDNQHESESILIDPALNLKQDTVPVSDVRNAIITLNDYIDEINIDAQTDQRGFILLTTDLGGSGDNPKVIQLSGDGSNELAITPRNLVFDSNKTTDVEIKFQNASMTPKNIQITGQAAAFGSTNSGANVILQSGDRNTFSSSSYIGNILLNLSSSNILAAKYLALSNRIISLFGEATTSNVTGTANDTLFIFNTSADPSNNPVSGSHLYSKSGKVKVMNSNGDKFNIGDTPSVWTNYSESTGTINKIGSSLVASTIPEIISSYTNSNNCIVMVTAKLVAKIAGSSAEAATFIVNASFYQDGGGMVEVGSNNIQLQRDDSGLFSVPTIVASTNSINVVTGDHNSDNSYWLAHVQYTINEV